MHSARCETIANRFCRGPRTMWWNTFRISWTQELHSVWRMQFSPLLAPSHHAILAIRRFPSQRCLRESTDSVAIQTCVHAREFHVGGRTNNLEFRRQGHGHIQVSNIRSQSILTDNQAFMVRDIVEQSLEWFRSCFVRWIDDVVPGFPFGPIRQFHIQFRWFGRWWALRNAIHAHEFSIDCLLLLLFLYLEMCFIGRNRHSVNSKWYWYSGGSYIKEDRSGSVRWEPNSEGKKFVWNEGANREKERENERESQWASIERINKMIEILCLVRGGMVLPCYYRQSFPMGTCFDSIQRSNGNHCVRYVSNKLLNLIQHRFQSDRSYLIVFAIQRMCPVDPHHYIIYV